MVGGGPSTQRSSRELHTRPFRILPQGPDGAARSRPSRSVALDIGCGGGFLAEEFAHLELRVVGVDPSGVSIETARRHAAANGLDLDYRVGFGERLPVADDEFDLAYCCDVLEHVSDLDAVISETARGLKPGDYSCSTPSIERWRANCLPSK